MSDDDSDTSSVKYSTAQDLDYLKRSRAAYKGKLTIFVKYFTNTQQKQLTAEDVIDLECRTEDLQVVYKKFDKIQTKIEAVSPDTDAQLEKRQEFEEVYFSYLAKAKFLIQSLKPDSKGIPSPQPVPQPQQSDLNDFIKLPEIILPTFSGEFKDWLEFRETFDALINASSLKPIQKYKYLRSCLRDGALEVVNSVEYTGEKYALAWSLLCQRYNNTRLLVNNHLKSLFETAAIKAESASALRSLIDNITKHLRCLRSLNIPTNEWDHVVIYFMSAKLPTNLQKKWEERIDSNELPSLQDFKTFLRKHADLLESMGTRGSDEQNSQSAFAKKTLVATSTSATPHPARYSVTCPQCKGRHYINQCTKFLALSVLERIRAAKRFRLCTNCLGSSHATPNCRSTLCKYCKGKHHSLLHIDRIQNPSNINNQTTEPSTITMNATLDASSARTQPNEHTQSQPSAGATMGMRQSTHTNNVVTQLVQNKTIFLSTALVHVYDKNNQCHVLRVLLDSGSQSNFITQSAYDLLQLNKQQINMEVIGFNNNSTNIQYLCDLKLESKSRKFSTNISCLIVPHICNLPNYDVNTQLFNIPQHLELADENFHIASEIDILIGTELFYELLCIGQYRLGDGLPMLQRTQLGWIVTGALSSSYLGLQKVRCNLSLNAQLKKFWEIEECNDKLTCTDSYSGLSHDDAQCEEIFNSHTRSSDGNFVVNLPLKAPTSLLGESKGTATQRFYSLEKKFSRDENLKQMYSKFMKDFEQAGRMVKANFDSDVQLNYLPHHAVINFEKVSTPLRVVFDASCATSTGVSLNDLQYKGSIKQDTLLDIILRFRLHKFVVNADIEKMFCNILLNPNQQHLQCILWRENPNHKLDTYALTTLSFGLKSAPHIATRCLLQLSHETHTKLQTHSTATSTSVRAAAATAIASDFYLDDLITGGDDELRVAEVAQEIYQILRSANFTLRKWHSNSPIIQGKLCTLTNTHITSEHTQNVQFGDKTNKILGLGWSGNDDSLVYSIKLNPMPVPTTKRTILSRLSSIFDPLGLLGPILITAKCFIQKLWLDKSGWDDPVSDELFSEWLIFYEKLKFINNFKIPRHVAASHYILIELHGFSDSSQNAYGAAIYLRTIDSNQQIIVRLLLAKSRVAPIKKQTIPRLELCAALLLAKQMHNVKNALKIPINKFKYWSDSSITLAWIKTPTYKLNTFVANRVSDIQSITDQNDWQWVSTYDNPADLLSRGVPADKLISSSIWWHGPSWLSKPSNEWPQQDHKLETTLPELKKQNTTCNTIITQTRKDFINNLMTKWSSATKLFRVFSYVLRFIHNCRNKNNKIIVSLSSTEIKQSINILSKYSQMESFPCEYKLLMSNKELPRDSKLKSLLPFFDNGLIRVGGRISQSQYSYDKKHPILLHSNHILTKLIMRSEHVRLLHAGPQLLLSSTRERYWPIQGKVLAKRIVRECVTCFRAKPETTIPIMGNLPSSRLTPAPPFMTTGLDYAGPFVLRDRRGRGYKTYKSYVSIFICYATKAIHLELITGLETEAFLAAFRRFISRRGIPKTVVSDNGTTFHGAHNDLKELYSFVDQCTDELTTFYANHGIEWKFIPVYTPHMGGLWEAGVKSFKFHLKRVVGISLLTYEEFSTLLVQVEAILNSRPICPLPQSDNEFIHILTPAHFMIGRPATALPDYDYNDIPTNRLKYYQQLQQMQQGFWRRWSKDYIGLLQQRVKWRSSKGPSLSTGTVVLVKEDRLPPCLWKLARIIQTHPGQDGIARVATMKTSKGTTIKRSFNRICPLPIDLD